MKLEVQLTVAVAYVGELLRVNHELQLKIHNERLPDDMKDKLANQQEDLQLTIEALLRTMGVDDLKWPGTYPVYTVDGQEYHTLEDALARTYGYPDWHSLTNFTLKCDK